MTWTSNDQPINWSLTGRATARTYGELDPGGTAVLCGVQHDLHAELEVGLGLGAQAGESRLRKVFAEAGFSRFQRATETPFNLNPRGPQVADLFAKTARARGELLDGGLDRREAPVASIKNQAGKYVAPSLQSTMAAAAGAAKDMPADFRVSLVNAPGDAAYPIASFTWILVDCEQPGESKGKAW